MKKKQLLFVMDTFPVGGIAKSLLALWNELGSEEYDIDFLLLKREGFLLPLIPKFVNLLPEPLEREFRSPHPRGILRNMKSMPFRRWVLWMKYSLLCSFGRLTGGLHKHICLMDQFIGKYSAPQTKTYDTAIAYAGGRCIYYVAMNVKSSVKIGYVHSDYQASEVDYMLKSTDLIYYPMMNHLITISKQCLNSLQTEFPHLAARCHVIENICSPNTIRQLAESGESFADQWEGFRLVSMGRLAIHNKGFDLALDACLILKEEKYPIRWYVLGDGVQKDELQTMIDRKGLHDTFILLGPKINPYPFIKDCDIFVHPSRFEGKSVALDEVKSLAKPIVVTRFSTVSDQFVDGKNGYIVDMTSEAIARKLKKLLDDESLRERLHRNLLMEKVGNVEQVDLFRKYILEK